MNKNGFISQPGFPKTAVIGPSGFLGSAFFLFCRRAFPDCIGADITTNPRIDLAAPDIKPLRLAKSGHKAAIIAAAIPGIKKCEDEKEYTRKINVKGTLELIGQLADEGIKPIFISSDYVFDGRTGNYPDDAKTNPITEYGRQKAEVEAKIGDITQGNYLVIRLSKVFSLNKGDGTFLDEMASILARGGKVKAAYDQVLCPTYVIDVVGAVIKLQAKGIKGIVNVCSPESWRRYDLAIAVAKAMGKKVDMIEKVSLDDVSEGIKRPKNTSLKPLKLAAEVGVTFMPVSNCIEIIAKNWKGS